MKYQLSNDTWDKVEMDAAHSVINSRNFTMGKHVKQYEQDFAKKFGARFAVMSNSGSSANLLSLASLLYSGRLHRGDEILVTAVSWSTTYFPISQCGFKIRFVDIDPDTLNVNSKALEHAITKDTKAIMAVNLLGNPNNFKELQNICKAYDLLLLEDNCEAMGAVYNEKMAGTYGLLGTFSSYFSHHICTMEGGITVTDDEELYHYMLAIRSHGWTRHLPPESSIYKKSTEEFYESFNFIVPGFNLRPLEIEAATGIEQLKKLDDFVAERRNNALYFCEQMKNRTGFRVQKEIGTSSWFGFAITLCEDKKGYREDYVRIFQKRDIEVRPIVAGNFTKQKALKFMEYSISGELKYADDIHDNGFFIGNHSIPMKEKIDYLMEALDEVK
jgi:Predicted pyridoxal phosphate-dependent enzyme apparently involved in regulation of cell wall biogenesis